MIKITFLNKLNYINIIPKLYDILHENMSVIAPTKNTYSEDYGIWVKKIIPALAKEPRQIILISEEDNIIGYFQYYINNNIFMMEEVQIKKEWQEKGVFRKLFGFIIDNIPKGISTVAAYANKKNDKSQRILEHMGLSIIEENENNFQYKGEYNNLLDCYGDNR